MISEQRTHGQLHLWNAAYHVHGLQAGQRDGRRALCPLGVWFGRGDKDLNTLQGSKSEGRKQIGSCPNSLRFQELSIEQVLVSEAAAVERR